MPYKEMSEQQNSFRKEIFYISWFIRLVSIVYMVSATLVLTGFVLPGVFIIGALGLSFLPGTFFGIPIEFGIDGGGENEWVGFIILPLVVILLGALTLWVGGQIKQFKRMGLILYTGIVVLLTGGIILDLVLRGSSNLNIVSGFIWIIFILSVGMLWYRFKKLGLLKSQAEKLYGAGRKYAKNKTFEGDEVEYALEQEAKEVARKGLD